MDRKRIADETIEILCNKLHALPLPAEDPEFEFDTMHFIPDITQDPLDIAEVTMDLEDAFGFNFNEHELGKEGLETIGQLIDFIIKTLSERFPQDV